jgi:integrase
VPRPRKWPPPVYHHKGRNEDRMVVYRSGKRELVPLGPHGSEEARAEYRRLLAEMEANGGELPIKATAELTVDELLDAYTAHAEVRYANSRNHRKQMERIYRSAEVASRLYGHTPALEFGPKALKAVRHAMASGSWLTEEERAERLKAGHGTGGWTRGHVNLCVGCVRRAFRWAVAEELIAAEHLQRLEAVEDLRKGEGGVREGKKIRPADEGAVEQTLPLLVRQAADIVRLMRLTGMRGDEACQMRPCDVNTSGKDPAGRTWEGLWVYTPGHHKAEGDEAEVKVIFLGPRCQEILRSYLNRPADAWCFSPREAVAERYAQLGRSFPRCKSRGPGEQYTTHALCVAVARAARRAGAKHWHPHQLRHGVATVVRAKWDLEHAKSALGQASLEAAKIYAEMDLGKAATVARELG